MNMALTFYERGCPEQGGLVPARVAWSMGYLTAVFLQAEMLDDGDDVVLPVRTTMVRDGESCCLADGYHLELSYCDDVKMKNAPELVD